MLLFVIRKADRCNFMGKKNERKRRLLLNFYTQTDMIRIRITRKEKKTAHIHKHAYLRVQKKSERENLILSFALNIKQIDEEEE